MPLRREDINKKGSLFPIFSLVYSESSSKVLPNSTRSFKAVFDRAQTILDGTFGFQLQELPSKAGLDQEAAAASAEKKGKKTSSGTQDRQGEDELEEARMATIGKKRGLLNCLSNDCHLSQLICLFFLRSGCRRFKDVYFAFHPGCQTH
jgi:hypothetical protein